MIPLQHLIPIETLNGNLAIGVVAADMTTGMPMVIAIAGFRDKEEIPEIAQYLYDQTMGIYNRFGKLDKIDIPDVYKQAWNNEG